MDPADHPPRGGTSREWELFYRASPPEPLIHVGSVSAPTVDIAREQAAKLFGDGDALWLCPADETVRLQREELGVGTDAGDAGQTMDESAMRETTLGGEDG
jgi:rSAM-partnered protein